MARKRDARSIIRAIVVIALALFALGTELPDLNFIWNPAHYGDYGFSGGQEVWSVDPGSAAADAKIRPGDSIDYRLTSLRQRFQLDGAAAPSPGEKFVLRVLRGTTARTVTLVARPAAKAPLVHSLNMVLLRVVGLVFITVGALLVLLRPSKMMWAFYFYALGVSSFATSSIFWSFLPAGWFATIVIARVLLMVGAAVGFYVFALRFPTDSVSGWRRWFEYAAPVIFIWLAFIWPYIYYYKGLILEQQLDYVPPIPGPFFFIGTYVLAGVFLVINYFRSSGPNRQKLMWVAVALAVSFVGIQSYALSYLLPAIPNWLVITGNVLGILVPVSVAYAIMRHRVFDITFVISRAVVYTIITLFAVAVFSLIDLVFIKMLANSTLGFAVDASAAIVMGFSINKLHGRLDYVVDSTFFRKHHRAEQRVIGLARELPHARSNDTVNRMLVSEPVEALKLSSGIVFRRSGNGQYVRQLAVGWPKTSYLELAADDPLVVQLRGLHSATRMPEVRKSSLELPVGDACPVLTLPVVASNELLAFALYGAHEHGTDLDPDEVHAINGLALGAAVAYEHLEAEALRHKMESMRLENEALRVKARADSGMQGSATASPPATA